MRGRMFLTLFSFLLLYCCQGLADENKLRLCVVKGQHNTKTIQKHCPVLNQYGSPVECVIENDRFTCLRSVAEENSDLTVLGPEDLVAAAAWTEFHVLVANELRLFPTMKHQYQVAALMRNSAGIQKLSDVKGKRFCHPGYESTDDWTPALATYFENILIEKECDPNKTLIENRVAAASKYFKAACMAGPWTSDTKLDYKLKSQYSNLCALCKNPTRCSSDDDYHGPEGALLCLTDTGADIAWVRVETAEAHFKNLGINKDLYSYLCPDETTRSMQTEKPCFWITKPWPVVVANSKKNDAVSRVMALLNAEDASWQSAFARLLENYRLAAIDPDNLGTPDDYLRRVPGFLNANSRASCRPSRTIKWCVSSNIEQRKCSWLHQASFVYGVEPKASCISRASRPECMEAVKEGKADLFVVKPDEELMARQMGLKRILHLLKNKKDDYNKVAAIVKRDSNIKNLQQLRGLKACFTGYQSVGWNAFVSIMRNTSGTGWDSSDSEAVSNFFKESCVLGLGNKTKTMPSNLYSLCKEAGEYGDEINTFKCLANGGGDVAFISLETVKKNTGPQNQRTWAHGLEENQFKPICMNESDNLDTCFLTWTTLGSVMVHQSISQVRFEEIYSALLQMDQLFGQKYTGQTPAFSMYGSYDGNRSIIFPEQTHHLQGDINMELQRSYDQIVDDFVLNLSPSAARNMHFTYFSLSVIYIAFTTLSRMICNFN